MKALLLSVLCFHANANEAGLYFTWMTDCSLLQDLDVTIAGGDTVLEWQQLQPSDNDHYNWTYAEQIMGTQPCGLPFSSFYVNAMYHPDWMRYQIPYTPSWDDSEDKDDFYLMWYHPNYIKARYKLVVGTSAWLSNQNQVALLANSGSTSVSVVRMNWDAVGTEHFGCPGNLTDPRSWTTPAGVPLGPWCNETATRDAYEAAILPSYVEGFTQPGAPRLFVRNNLALNPPLYESIEGYFRNGSLSWFHTSSEVEPRDSQTAQRYLVLRDWCKQGNTTCYAEPWADAWGPDPSERYDGPPAQGKLKGVHWCPPPAWVWWRVLSDLSNGVSFLAMYGDNLEVAARGTHKGAEVGAVYKGQFLAAARMAARYAPHVASPSNSPGGFVAMRRSVLDLGGYNREVQDYGFLARLTKASESLVPWMDARRDGAKAPVVQNQTFPGMRSIGPYHQRFGAWARKVGVTSTPIEVVLDAELAGRTAQGSGSPANGESSAWFVCVTALWDSSSARAALNVTLGQQGEGGSPRSFVFPGGTSPGEWQTFRIQVPGRLGPVPGGSEGAQVRVEAETARGEGEGEGVPGNGGIPPAGSLGQYVARVPSGRGGAGDGVAIHMVELVSGAADGSGDGVVCSCEWH